MTDVLDRLRSADPVDRARLAMPAELRDRVLAGPPRRPQPRRRRLVMAVATAAAAALTAGLLAGAFSASRPGSLADKAYAATSGPGIVHWGTETTNFRDGKPVAPQRSEGWARGEVQHILQYARSDGRMRVITDLRSDAKASRSWGAGANDYTDGPALRRDSAVRLGDPFAAFRRAHRAGHLIRLGPGRYAVKPAAGTPAYGSIVYELNRRTGMPLRQVLETRVPAAAGRAEHRYRSVMRFATYERLPDTTANRQLLNLLPHPGAGPVILDARPHFAVLRTAKPLTAAQRRVARAFEQARYGAKGQLRVEDARPARAGVVLLPGRGYLCVFVRGGGTCATIDRAVERGMAFGGSRVDGMVVVVPDGVRSVRGRLPRHAWRTFAVSDNVAILPNGGHRFRLHR